MRRIVITTISTLILLPAVVFVALPCPAMDARQIVEDAFHYWRGETSFAQVDMLIHRPTWQRTMTIEGWTRGDRDSLFRITAPVKDRGNGTLKLGRDMWMYNPRVNRVIKLPPSMMSQSWMGSDFSNNDLAKSDSLLHDYEHRITGTDVRDGKVVYRIDSVPRPDAPVIWGLQRLEIREDRIFLLEEFYDEDKTLVKSMSAEQIEEIDGRMFPRVWTMRQADDPENYTQLTYRRLSFHEQIPDRFFSTQSLQNP